MLAVCLDDRVARRRWSTRSHNPPARRGHRFRPVDDSPRRLTQSRPPAWWAGILLAGTAGNPVALGRRRFSHIFGRGATSAWRRTPRDTRACGDGRRSGAHVVRVIIGQMRPSRGSMLGASTKMLRHAGTPGRKPSVASFYRRDGLSGAARRRCDPPPSPSVARAQARRRSGTSCRRGTSTQYDHMRRRRLAASFTSARPSSPLPSGVNAATYLTSSMAGCLNLTFPPRRLSGFDGQVPPGGCTLTGERGAKCARQTLLLRRSRSAGGPALCPETACVSRPAPSGGARSTPTGFTTVPCSICRARTSRRRATPTRCRGGRHEHTRWAVVPKARDSESTVDLRRQVNVYVGYLRSTGAATSATRVSGTTLNSTEDAFRADARNGSKAMPRTRAAATCACGRPRRSQAALPVLPRGCLRCHRGDRDCSLRCPEREPATPTCPAHQEAIWVREGRRPGHCPRLPRSQLLDVGVDHGGMMGEMP